MFLSEKVDNGALLRRVKYEADVVDEADEAEKADEADDEVATTRWEVPVARQNESPCQLCNSGRVRPWAVCHGDVGLLCGCQVDVVHACFIF